MTLEIKGFLETSLLDWDGKIVSTVFLPRCNLRCPFCHNSGLVESPQAYATVPETRVHQYLEEHKDYIDGVCITGGEPILHVRTGLLDFMRQIKQQGFLIKLDTNGTDPASLKKILAEGLVDYVAMDIKGPLDERYSKLSGVKTDLAKIKQSIKAIIDSGVDHEFRTTVVPTLLKGDDVAAMAKYLKDANKFVLQQFVPEHSWDEALRNLKPLSGEELQQLAAQAKEFVPSTITRGV